MTEKVWLTNRIEEQLMFEGQFTLSIGQPKATKNYTVEQLEGMGLVGIYRDTED